LILAAITDSVLRLRILEELPNHGWRVLTAGTGEEIPALVAQHGPEAMLIDIGMADQAAAIIRTVSLPRVAMVQLSDIESCLTLLLALRVNCCHPLPLHTDFLAASLDGLLRLVRPAAADSAAMTGPRSGETMGHWRLLRSTWTLASPGATPVQLTQAETTFLATLAENPGHPVSRTQMIAALGHNVDYYDSRRLDTMVSRLRLKVSKDGPALPVRCIHSVGYAFVAPISVDD
jgi:DNA-binding response OmpR family regulator